MHIVADIMLWLALIGSIVYLATEAANIIIDSLKRVLAEENTNTEL